MSTAAVRMSEMLKKIPEIMIKIFKNNDIK